MHINTEMYIKQSIVEAGDTINAERVPARLVCPQKPSRQTLLRI